MTKLKLKVEELGVESFPIGDADGVFGTVQAREAVPTPPYTSCQPFTRLTDCPCTPAY